MYDIRALFGAIVVVAGCAVTCAAGEEGCSFRYAYQWLSTQKDQEGYTIRVADPAHVRQELNWSGSSDMASARANLIPQGRVSVIPSGEYLASEALSTILYVDRDQSSRPLPIDGAWHGADPLSCLRAFAEAAGLEVAVPQPGLWLVGSREFVERTAVLVFAYSPDITVQSLQSEASTRDLERAFLSSLPVRQVPRPPQRDDGTYELSPALIGLGYYAVPGEPNTYLVVATQGTFTNPTYGLEVLSTTAFKVVAQRGGGHVAVKCLWSAFVTGPLVAGIQEDLDGDGLQDFYFQEAGDSDQPDVILSGSDGSVIAKVAGETIAVEKDVAGPKRFSVTRIWEQEGKARVYRVNPESRELAVVGPQVATASAAGTGQPSVLGGFDWPADAMAATLGSLDRVRVYCLPGFHAPHLPGMDFVKVHSSSVWGWFLNKNPKQAIEQIPPQLAMHVVFRYLSPGYVQERQKEKTAGQR
jgi:hypothetical protein